MFTLHLRLILHDDLGRSDGNMNGYIVALNMNGYIVALDS